MLGQYFSGYLFNSRKSILLHVRSGYVMLGPILSG